MKRVAWMKSPNPIQQVQMQTEAIWNSQDVVRSDSVFACV